MSTRIFQTAFLLMTALVVAVGQPFTRTYPQANTFSTDQIRPVAGGFDLRTRKTGTAIWRDLRLDDEGEFLSAENVVCPGSNDSRFFRMADGGCLAVLVKAQQSEISFKKYLKKVLVWEETVDIGPNLVQFAGLELFDEQPGMGFVVGGLLKETVNPGTVVEHTFLVKFKSDLTLDWSRWLDFSSANPSVYRAFHLLPDGFVAAEVANENNNASPFFIQKIGKLPDFPQPIFTAAVHPANGGEYAHNWFATTPDGGFLTFGTVTPPSGGQFFLRKFDENGVKTWEKDNSQLFSPSLVDFNSGGKVQHFFALHAPAGGFEVGGWLQKTSASPRKLFLLKTDENGQPTAPVKLLSSVPQTFETAQFLADGSLLLAGELADNPWLMRVGADGAGAAFTIQGRVFDDASKNCQFDTGEKPLSGWLVQITGGADTIWATTNVEGRFEIQVDSGTYHVSTVLPSLAWEACQAVQNVMTTASGTTNFEVNFPIRPLVDCPRMRVDVAAPTMRRCFQNSFVVRYFNDGTTIANDVKIYLDLTQLLDYQGATIPLAGHVGTVYQFIIGSVGLNESGQFSFSAIPNCTAPLGQAVCLTAKIFPDAVCGASSAWSGASVDVEGVCKTDSVSFTIKNNGTGNSHPLEYIIIDDVVIMRTGKIQLNMGAEKKETVPTDGSTFRLLIMQEPNHPDAFSFPTAAVEGCATNGTAVNYGFVNQFSDDGGSPSRSVECRELTGTIDPNELTASPQGVDNQHFIRPETNLDYIVRFQNLGTDTAFTLLVRDTLDGWLDASSVQFLAASHACNFSVVSGGVVKAFFENIHLPDSLTNKEGSKGWLKFRVRPKTTVPLGTIVHNRAVSFFDANPATLTNQTFHTIDTTFLSFKTVVKTVENEGDEPSAWAVFPNPISSGQRLGLRGKNTFETKNLENFQLHIFDLMGRSIWETAGEPTGFPLKNDLPSGVYFFEILEKGRLTTRGRLAVF